VEPHVEPENGMIKSKRTEERFDNGEWSIASLQTLEGKLQRLRIVIPDATLLM